MAITTMDGVVASFPGQRRPISKTSFTTVAGAYSTLLNATGQPGAGTLTISNTTTGVIPTSATDGAVPFTNPGAGNSYLMQAEFSSSSPGSIIIYDRLQHSGSYSFASGNINTTDQTAVDRDSTGAGVEVWCEVNGALSATACTLTITYTDQSGNTGATGTCVVPASAITARMFPFVLAAGDSGVRSIENLAGSAAPTGSFNIVMLRRLGTVEMGIAGISGIKDFAALGMPRIYDNACICLLMNTNTTTSGLVSGSIVIGQG